MRLRLRLLLPLALSLLVGAGFLLAAISVGQLLRGAPASDAPSEAVRVVVLWGVITVAAAVALGAVVARMIAMPLRELRDATAHLTDPGQHSPTGSRVAEIEDIARGLTRAATELRSRHERELRERSELAAVVETVSEGILQVDRTGRIVRVNPAGARLLRLPPDAAGRTVASMVRNADLRAMLRGRAAPGAGSGEVVLDDRRILVSTRTLRDGGAVMTLVDLTDLRRLEEVRRDFVANASHELKTPLTSIRGYTETLLADDLPEAQRREFLRTVARNADRLQRVVDDLLDLSRLESGRWEPDLAPVDPALIATIAWQPFTERARRQEVALEVEPGHDVQALADPLALEHVFTNLYDNALRYTPPGGRIGVRVRQESGETGPRVIIEVTDTGAGIPRDVLPRIFERFYRVDPARSRAEGGTGLGLSIVRHMLEAMGGTATATSELGKGTTIRLQLAAARDPRYERVTER